MTGSNNNSSDNNGFISHAIHPRDDRETLSALFDGELPSDAIRFALKRLDHEASWRETCGRWQLIGDALRGQATTAAPADFAANVMRALSAEAQPAIAVAALQAGPTTAAMRPRWRWMGGAALAASVAVAAVLVVRPFSQPSTSAAEGQMAVNSKAIAPVAATSSQPSAPLLPRLPEDPAASIAADAAKVAAVATTTERSIRRVARSTRAARNPGVTSASGLDSLPTTVVASAAVPTRQPFHPPSDEIVTRPWPRAVLPEANASGGVTVGFGAGSLASPSLYPFEPHLPAAETQPTGDPQR